MRYIKNSLAEKISEGMEIEVDPGSIERPEPEHGDFAYPVMKPASKLDENPRALAQRISGKVEELEMVQKVEVAGPGYLNIHLKKEIYAGKVAKTLEEDGIGVEQKEGSMVVEFSSPNLAKPMHIGHVRNNCLGDSIQRIMRFVGYNVTSENYIGDWGTKHGQVIYAYRKWGSKKDFEENPMEHMYELYVKLHEEADEEDKKKARDWSRKIEEGDDEAVEIWEMFREATIEYNQKEYERLGIEFDRVTGESVVAEQAEEIIQEGLEKNIFEEDSDGSVYTEFGEEMPSTVVKRADGSTLYLSRDIANIRKREQEGFDQNLYIVASEQNLHFRQLFDLAKRFGIKDIENEHISYGMLHLEEGSMSSSKGNIIRLSDVLDRAVEKARKIEGREIGNAEEVGIGAVKYANLAVSRQKDIEFEWEDVLTFEGDSGPYLQYSNTRAKSILEKTDKKPEIEGELSEEEYRLVRKLGEFPEKIESSARNKDPAKIANYLTALCEEFNSFYHSCNVIGEDETTEKRRLKIVELFVNVTDQGLELLGIQPLDEM